MAVLVGAVIVGGIKSIANITDKLVPFMAVLYVGTGLVILAIEYDRIGWAFGQIIDGAFTAEGVAGGVVGALIQGFKRAAFSNEAGIGSAAIAHSAVKTNEPMTEGFVALLEPFIDTVVICTMTALVIVITGSLDSGKTGVALTSHAFGTALSWFPYVLVVAVVLFRVLDDDLVVLLRPQGLDLPVRRGQRRNRSSRSSSAVRRHRLEHEHWGR